METKQNMFANVCGSAFDFAKACVVTNNISKHCEVHDPQATADKKLSEPTVSFSFAMLITTSTVYLYLIVCQYSSKVVYGFFMQIN